MSFLSTRFIRLVRNISPCLCFKFSQNNGFQRFYCRQPDGFAELSSALQSVENYVRGISTGGGRSYKLELDIPEGVKHEHIKVTLRRNELIITGRDSHEFDDGTRCVDEYNDFYSLPSDINPDTIRSSITEGILTIEAPLPALESKIIPINIENGDSSSNSQSEEK